MQRTVNCTPSCSYLPSSPAGKRPAPLNARSLRQLSRLESQCLDSMHSLFTGGTTSLQPSQYRRGGKEVRLYSASSLGQLVVLQVQERNYVVGSLHECLCTTCLGRWKLRCKINMSLLTKSVVLAQRGAALPFKSLSRGAENYRKGVRM